MTKQQTPTLEQRIGAALGNGSSLGSEVLYELIRDTDQAVAKATADVEAAREQAMDITVDAAAAALALTTSQLTCDRLKTALPRLRERLATALADEAVQKWLARSKRLGVEVDALGAEVAEAYPRLINELISLFSRCVAQDRQVNELNIELPAGVQPLPTAEMKARRVDRFTTNTPSIIASTVLVDDNGKQIWPPARSSIAVVPVPIVPGLSADWHQDLGRQQEERRQEWAKVVSEHQRRTEAQAQKLEQEDKAKIEANRKAREANFGPSAA